MRAVKRKFILAPIAAAAVLSFLPIPATAGPPNDVPRNSPRPAAEKPNRQTEVNRTSRRNWRFRIHAQFAGIWGLYGGALGSEFGVQLELYNRHIIQLVGVMGSLYRSSLGGGAVGYAYEWEPVRDIVRFELGFLLGGFFMHEEKRDGSNESASLTFFQLRPVLHLGYRRIFFSIGPRVAIGRFVHYGFAAGLTVRI
jgi:hypothetical protein